MNPFLDASTNPFLRQTTRQAIRATAAPLNPSLTPVETEEEPGSILGSIGRGALSGLGYIGETFSKPGRALWGTLSGLTSGDFGGGLLNLIPFSDTLGITDPREGIEGSGFLEHAGVLPENKPGFDWLDPVRLAADIAGDPLMPLSFGASAIGKAGQAAKAAGLMDDLARVASKKAGRRVGPREARMTVTPDDLLRHAPAKREAFERAAAGMGLDPVKAATEHVGGLVGLGKPFMRASTTVGAPGGLAQRVARGLDTAGDALRFGNIPGTSYSPGRQVAELFDRSVQGRKLADNQEAMTRLTRRQADEEAEIMSENYRLLQGLKDADKLDPASQTLLRRMAEGVASPAEIAANPQLHDTAEALVRLAEGDRLAALDRGQFAATLQDDAGIRHLFRKGNVEAPTVGKRGFKGRGPDDVHRRLAYKGFHGGTESVNEFLRDPDLNKIIADGYAQGWKKKKIANEIRGWIAKHPHWSQEIIELVPKVGRSGKPILDASGQPVMVDRWRALANAAQAMSEKTRSEGLFVNSPMADALQQRMARMRKRTNFDTFIEELPAHIGAPQEGSRSVRELFAQFGVKGAANRKQAALLLLKQASGGVLPSLPKKDLNALGKALLDQHVPGEWAADLMMRPAATVERKGLSRAYDAYTNLFKAGVLSHPARVVRDGVSAVARLMEAHLLSNPVKSPVRAVKMLQDGVIDDAHTVPIVAKMLADRGLPATPEEGTKILSQLYATYGPGTRNIYTDTAGAAAKGIDPTLEQMLQAMPGSHATGPGELGRMFMGRTPTTTIDPRVAEVRGGFTNAKETTLGPIAAFERASSWTDHMGRLTGFLDELYRGVDPAEAMRRVNAALVNYDPKTFTPTEQQLKRLFPFWTFFSRNIKHVAKSLAEQPGGRTAQAVRLANEMRGDDPTAPDYVQETLSVPMGTLPDGSKRYLTGLGMMSEDAFRPFGGGIQGALYDLAGRLNPLLKGPLELATDESFFQEGDQGGRALEDLDPTIGRTLSNIAGREEPVHTPFALEFAIGNSPLARLATTARSISDTRKHNPMGIANLLSGVRVADIGVPQQEGIARDRAQSLMRSLGARSFTKVFFDKDELAAMTPEQRKDAEALNSLLTELAKRAKQRRQAADAQPAP